MPHNAVKIIPGVDTTRTIALNEAALSSTNLVRLVPDRQGLGLVQKLGGWQAYYEFPFTSTVRALKGWADLNSDNHLAVGAETSLSVLTDGTLLDITPLSYDTEISPDFSSTSGSNIINVVDPTIQNSTYNYVVYVTPVSVGGLILQGQYKVQAVSGSQYSIYPASNATSTEDTTVAISAGSFVVDKAYIIDTVGTTDFTLIGAPSNTAGVIFVATGVGTGTGTAKPLALQAFKTTSGSADISVAFNDHGLVVGSIFTIDPRVAITIGGVILSGTYTVSTVPNDNVFTFVAQDLATSSAGYTAINGGLAYSEFYIANGPASNVVGYGVGGYGVGGYGVGSTLVAVNAGSFTIGAEYTIATVGTTDFTLIGASSNTVGVVFTATGVGSGTGTAYPVITAGDPITATDWSLDNFGQILIANPTGGAIYYYDPTGIVKTGQLLSEQVPLFNTGCFVSMPQRQIIAYGSSFGLDQDPLLVRWCDIEDFGVWIASSTNQAGSYRIPSGSKIVSGMQAYQQGLFWTDLDLWSMQYIGPPFVYGFNKIAANCGAISRKSSGQLNNVVYWMSQKQFFRFGGQGAEPLPCPVWDVIFQNLKQGNDGNGVPYIERIRCGVNSQYNEVTWYYPSANGNGENDSYVKYNVTLNQWDFGQLGRTAWIDQSVLGPPIGSGSDNFLYQHEIGNTAASGTTQQAMLSTMRTGYFSLSEADQLIFIDQIWPDMKWGTYSGSQNATVFLTFYVTNYPGDPPTAYGPYTMTQATEYISTRIRARLMSIEISSPSDPALINQFWRTGNIRYRFQADGRF